MRTRILASTSLMLCLVLRVSAAPAPVIKNTAGPPVVFQLAPGQKLLESVKKIVGLVAGEGFGGLIDGQIQAKLGEKGFSGLDMKRPIGGYLFLPNKQLKGPEEIKEIYGFLAIPVTGENEFKDFILRIEPNNPLNFKAVEGNKGLYALETNDGESEVPIRARFHDGHVYIGINAKDELLDEKSLLSNKQIVKPDDPGLLLVRIFSDRYPEELLKQQNQQLEELNGQVQNLGPWSVVAGNILKSYTAMSQRMTMQMKDTDESGFRVAFDEKAADIAIESYAIPKKGTAYAKELAAMKPTANRFASLITDSTAAGGLFQLPIAAPEMRDIFNQMIEAGQKSKDDAPEYVRPVIDELLKGLGRTIKGESIDFALSVNGPNKDGKFSFVGAVNFDDASGLEKAVKEAVKSEEFKEKLGHDIKFDVEKIDGINIHRRTTEGQDDASETLNKIFGTKEVYYVFGPKGIYIAAGPDWKDTMKAALAAKAAPTKVIDLVANPKRLGDLIKAGSEQAGGIAATMLGTEDRRFSLFSVSYEGGATLKARVTISLKGLPKMMMFWATPFRGG